MGEPMSLQDIFFGTMAGAAIVLTGATYAMFFALGRLHRSGWFMAAAFLSFGLLATATYVLVKALSLSGVWILVTATMLVGYFFLPRAIWHLCVGTHAGESANTHSRATQ